MAEALPIDVWVVYPDKVSSRYREVRKSLYKECKARGWNFQARASLRVNVHPGGRMRDILPAKEATTLYRRAHRAYVAVIIFTPTHVLLHPDQDDAIRRGLIERLQRLFQYKCFIELLDDKTECDAGWV